MKKFITSTLAVMLSFQYASAFQFTHQGTTLDYSVLDESGKTCEVIRSYVEGDIVIPSVVTDSKNVQYKVTSIGKKAFANRSNLKSVSLPNTITEIGDSAFYYCSAITSLNIPSSVSHIGDYALYFCSAITSLNIPSSVTHIGDYAFYYCGGLSSVIIPEWIDTIGNGVFCGTTLSSIYFNGNIKSIGDKALMHCSNLTNITLPGSVSSIGEDAFSYSGLTTITIPESVTEIPDVCFYDCENLKSVKLPSNLKSIGASAFYLCTCLTSIDIPELVESIGIHAFNSCSSLKSVRLPENLGEIARYAFASCTALTDINIPSAITSIGESAFYNCGSLESVFIPGTVTSIGDRAFYDCRGLREIFYDTAEPVKANSNVFPSYGWNFTPTLYIAFGGLKVAQSTTPWSNFSRIQEKYFGSDPKAVIVKLPGGNLHFPEEAAGITVRLTADEGYEFHSASLDDDDVSGLVDENGNFTIPAVEKPTMLNVVYKGTEDIPTEVMDISASLGEEVRVTVHGKRINITGKDADAEVRAYDINGILLEKTTADEFTLNYSGVVILAVGRQVYKFAI